MSLADFSSPSPLVIYHANCSDGFAAAWAVRRRFPGAELYAATYQTPAPEVRGRDVVIVDFSFSREVTERLRAEAREFLLLDHHATAEDDLAGVPGCFFDRTRSGAEIAWDWFHLTPRPDFLTYIGDGDRWAWELADSRTINEYLRIAPKTIESYDALAELSPEELRRRGEIARLASSNYRALVAGNALPAIIAEIPEDGIDPRFREPTLGVNAPPWNHSELLADLALRSPAGYAFSYYQKGDGSWSYSFRAAPGGPDVARFAKQFGGGGHPSAANFVSPTVRHAILR